MIAMQPSEIEARKQHKLASMYSEGFLKSKGLWEEFLDYATEKKNKEDAKHECWDVCK